MTSGAARAFVTLLAIALFVAFIKGGPAEMWAWLARTLTGDPSHTSTIRKWRPAPRHPSGTPMQQQTNPDGSITIIPVP